MHRLLALVSLAILWPSLPGAGCRGHHAASITAEVSGSRAPVLLYVARGADCPTGVECLDRPELWRPIRGCEASRDLGPLRNDAIRVQGCTAYIGVDYRIDIMAFDDGNGNGRLDRGERYGLWSDGPMRREREATVVTIAIDRVR